MRADELNLIFLAQVNCSGLILQPRVQPLFLLKQRGEETKKGQLLGWERTKVELEKDPKRQLKCNFHLACKGISLPMERKIKKINFSFKGGRSGLLPGS